MELLMTNMAVDMLQTDTRPTTTWLITPTPTHPNILFPKPMTLGMKHSSQT